MTLRFMVVTSPKKKKSVYNFSVLSNEPKMYDCVFFGNTLPPMITVDTFLAVKKFDINHQIDDDAMTCLKFNERTKFFQIAPFEPDHSTLDNFLNSPTVSIAEANGSPRKRRMSITGTVTNSNEAHDTGKWRRLDVTVKDPQTSMSLLVKLWNEKSDHKLAAGDTVFVKNLEAEEYMGMKYLQSTSTTEVKITKQAPTEILLVSGLDVQETDVILLVDDDEYVIDRALLEQTVGDSFALVSTLPLKLTAVVSNRRITKLQDQDGTSH